MERRGGRGSEEVVDGAAPVVACPVVCPWVALGGGHIGAVGCAEGAGEGERGRELTDLEIGCRLFKGRCEDDGGGGEEEESVRMHIGDWEKRYVVDLSFLFFPWLQVIEDCLCNLNV